MLGLDFPPALTLTRARGLATVTCRLRSAPALSWFFLVCVVFPPCLFNAVPLEPSLSERWGCEQPLRTGWFYLGFVLYASTAFGWVFVMSRLKLATISVLYSVSLVLLLTAVGVVLFRESLSYFEVIGIILAVASLVLLMRFA